MSGAVTNRAIKYDGRLTALLGPTNTGKTHAALTRMLDHHSGCMGFPLRLLARENYDRVVAEKGIHAVALVTGEEKIIPQHARYFLCTVESMPVTDTYDFLAVDEIQLAADPDRGHIFTDRLLRARGRLETMFCGADTIAPLIRQLVPDCLIETRPRLSTLSYKGFQKVTRLPRRSAVVAFSIDEVYRIAELIKRQRGGTAIVLGALSPRTRNAQVAMYQSGEVDFMVATDAIGMGLNMDIQHVALAATRKFDGSRLRGLRPAEIAQIAGRAGRYMKDGTFGVTGSVHDLDPDIIDAVQNHVFQPLEQLVWRNANEQFASPAMLRRSLEYGSGTPLLVKGHRAEDLQALDKLMGRDDIMARASTPDTVQLLWDVCQIPDFRKTLSDAHQELLATIYLRLLSAHDGGLAPLDQDWVAGHIDRLDRVDGDVDTLMARIAHIRTWTYIAHKRAWLKDAFAWQERTKAIEDRLSDALHEGLTARFVDRRNAVLIRGLQQGEAILGGVRADGSVVVEGHVVGQLHGFQFIPEQPLTRADARMFLTVARHVLKPEVTRRVMSVKEATDKQFRVTDDASILYQPEATNPLPGQPIARLTRGASLLTPEVVMLESDLLAGDEREAVQARLSQFVTDHIKTVLAPLFAAADETAFTGAARGIAWQVHEALGTIPRAQVEDLLTTLEPDGRKQLRDKGIRLGPLLIYIPLLNKPASVHLRGLLWTLWHNATLPVTVPYDGAVSAVVDPATANASFYQSIGYPLYGPRVCRIDMLDRVVTSIYDSAKDGKFQAQHKMAEWLGCSIPDLYAIITAMGHRLVAEAPPAEAPPAEPTPSPAIEIAADAVEIAAEIAADTPASAEVDTSVEAPAEVAAEVAVEVAASVDVVKPAIRPELATFQLRRGKAHQTAQARRPRSDNRPDNRSNEGQGQNQPFKRASESRSDKARDGEPRGERKFGEGKPDFRRNDRNKDGGAEHVPAFRKKKPTKPIIKDSTPRNFSADAKASDDDNPFAVLKKLQLGDK